MANKHWHPTRRDAVKGAAVSGLVAGVACAAPADAGSIIATRAPPIGSTILWYAQPAASWTEALPIGAGLIGAMVHGGTDREHIQLNEATMWAGQPHEPANPAALAALPELQRLVFAGRFAEAQALYDTSLIGTPRRQMPYGTIGTLVIERPGTPPSPPPRKAPGFSGPPVTPPVAPAPLPGYRRELDLDSALAATRWTQDGVEFRREVIAAPDDGVVAVRITADRRGAIDLDLSFTTPIRNAKVAPGRADELVLTGDNQAAYGLTGKLRGEARLHARCTDGRITQSGDRLSVRGASAVVLVIAMATNYRRFDDIGGDPTALTSERIDRARRRGFAAIAADAARSHRALFRRVTLDLGATDAAALPSDQRIRGGESGLDRSLTTLYFNYTRYLLIASSRPGAQAANLQGIWNDSLDPPWGSKYTININLQMCYWPAEPTNLAECVEPLIRLVRELSVTGAVTAKRMYGARGWVCHHVTDLWRATAPAGALGAAMWPTGGAWLALHLWEHYDYNRDLNYLRSVYPLLRGAALFFLDTLQKDPTTGHLVTNPSSSPENNHHKGVSICAGPTMDMGILRDLFTQTAQAATLLGQDAALAREFLAARDKLAPYKIGAQGQLMEWQEDWDGQAPEQRHRHVSHLYGVYPSHQISADRTPELAAAARRSLEIRGDEATGWATAWRIALWARLGDGDRAHRILRYLIGPKRTYPNMFDAHPPFQIDGNFGGAAAIVEMLMSGNDGELKILPALPSAWPDGSVRGLRARGNCAVDIVWADGALRSLTLVPGGDLKMTVRYRGTVRDVNLRRGRTERFVGPQLEQA